MLYMHVNKGSNQGPIDDMNMSDLKCWRQIVPYDAGLQIHVGLQDISVKPIQQISCTKKVIHYTFTAFIEY